MSVARIAALLTAAGYVSLVVGLAMVETWLALVVGGALLILLGFLIDDRKPPSKLTLPQPKAGP